MTGAEHDLTAANDRPEAEALAGRAHLGGERGR